MTDHGRQPPPGDDDLARFRSAAYSWLTGPVRVALDYQPGVSSTVVDFSELGTEAADGYASLLGLRTRPRGRIRINLGRVNTALLSSRPGIGLLDLLTALGGPLAGTLATRTAARVAGQQLWEQAAAHPALDRHPELAGWLDQERGGGKLPADPVRRAEVLAVALDVAALLAGDGTGLARLGWRACRDTKVLTRPGHERSAALRAVAALYGQPFPAGAAAERALWAAAGVRVDPVSSHVLVAGLRPAGGDVVAAALGAHAGSGLALRLTLAQVDVLVAEPAPSTPVFVVENPEAHTALAADLGEGAALVCTEGWPHLAALRLLHWLSVSGAPVRHHSDFDWDGVAITGMLAAEGFTPWRMGAADYRRAVAASREHSHPLPPLTGERVDADWDRALPRVMAQLGLEVHEEDDAVIALLAADLRGGFAENVGI